MSRLQVRLVGSARPSRNVQRDPGKKGKRINAQRALEHIAGFISILTLGDIFSCGTCGGVGQGTNSFLKIGDVMETEVESLGKMRNRFVAETA